MFIHLNTSFCLLAALATSVLRADAHGVVRKWTITNTGETESHVGSDYGQHESTAARLRAEAEANIDGPQRGTTAPSIACNSPYLEAAQTWPVKAGSTVTAHWSHTGGADPDTLSSTNAERYFASDHRGPVIEYMAACPSAGCNGDKDMDLDWFKISESVEHNGDWAAKTVITTGQWSFDIPTDIKSGPYLIRHEVIALHSKTEVYPVCIQVEVESSGSQTPEGVKFPAIYTEYSQDYLNTSWLNDPSQLASTLASFIPPGPPVHGGNGIAKPGAGTQPIEHKGAGSGNTTSLQGAPLEGTPAASAQGTAPVISPPVASPVTSPVVSPGLVGAADKAEVSPGDKPLAPSGGPKAGSLGSNKAVVLPDPAAPAPVSPGATADQDAASNISGGNCIFGHYQCLGTEMQVCQNLAESKIGWIPDHSCPGGCKVEADGVHRECFV